MKTYEELSKSDSVLINTKEYEKLSYDTVIKDFQKVIPEGQPYLKQNQFEKINYKYPNLKIGVIIPAFNEEYNLGAVLSKIQYNEYKKLDIIIINDGSTDRTFEIAKSFNAIILNHMENRGNGAATITGLKYCNYHKYDIAIILDADGQHDPRYIDYFINPIIKKEVDFVIGNRFKSFYKSNIKKLFCSKLMTAFYFILYRKKICDPTNGYRALSSKCFSNLNFESEYSTTQEMLFKILPSYKYKEIPIIVNQRENGESFINLKSYLSKMILMVMKFYIFPKMRKLTAMIFNENTKKRIRNHYLKT